MYFLAFDLGATSGRAILGSVDNGRLASEEVYRFPNAVKEIGGNAFRLCEKNVILPPGLTHNTRILI